MRASLSAALICALVLAVAPGPALSGIEPSPFKPEINRLGAIVNTLFSINDRVVKVLASPPGDQVPSPNLNGAVNRLEAMTGQVELQTTMMHSVMGEALVTDGDITEVYPALMEVVGAAGNIADTVDAYLCTPPDDTTPPDFCNALSGLGSAALDLEFEAQAYMDTGGVVCSDITDPFACNNTTGCVWLSDTGPAGEIDTCVEDPGTAP